MAIRSSYVKRDRLDTSMPVIRKESFGSKLGRTIGGAVRAYNQLPARLRYEWFGDKNALRQAVAAGDMNPDGTYVLDDYMQKWEEDKKKSSNAGSMSQTSDDENTIREAAEMTDVDKADEGVPTEDQELEVYRPYYIPKNTQDAYDAFEKAKPVGYGERTEVVEFDPNKSMTKDEINAWQEYLGVRPNGKGTGFWGKETQRAYDALVEADDSLPAIEDENVDWEYWR